LPRRAANTASPATTASAAAAALAERTSARRATAETEAARRDGDRLLDRLGTLADGGAQPGGPELAAALLQCRAEQTRLHGPADPAAWAAAATRWEALGRPYPAAYARFREAEALLASRAPRARVEKALQAAHQVAARLGASPLRRELELLARRGRVRLQSPPQQPRAAEPEASSAARSMGLTRRELQVLELVAAGRSNRQIGEELAKLGVAGRGEAAAVAHRLGSGSEWMERSLAWAVPTWRTTSACSATPTRVAVATECRSWWPTGTPTSATCSATA
jgi:Bacterial regulatory proteins, luxR family